MASSLIHRVRLQHVRCLLATAQHGNMRAAADTLAITQPAVSKIIKELEDLVGQALVKRQRHGVVLTPAGEVFVQHARQGVIALEQALGCAQQPEGGPLSLGVLPTLAVDLVNDVLAAWQASGGTGSVRVITGRNAELLAQLQRGELDVVMGRLAEPDRMMDLRFEPMWAEPLIVAMSPEHPLAKAPWSAWRDLTCPVVRPLPGTGIRQVTDAFMSQLECGADHSGLETLVVSVARDMTLQGQAVWFTPMSAVRRDLDKGSLIGRLLPGTATEAVGMFMQAGGVVPSARAAALAGVVREVAHAWRMQSLDRMDKLTQSQI
jgi:LysR family transcriptional regulator, pca operon transcriptional activator